MHTLILDIGGIFFSPAWREQGINEVSTKLGVQKEQFKIALQKEKDNFYRGKILERDYWKSVLDALSIKTYTPDDMQKIYRTYITPIAETLGFLPALSKCNTLICCNNSPKEWMDERIRTADLNQYFSIFFTSGYTHFQKPSVDMYLQVFEYAARIGYPITYIDDNEQYVEVVQNLDLGIETEVYSNPDSLLRWIR
jgi:FMN phosphatase YigB (HAD superfamily)